MSTGYHTSAVAPADTTSGMPMIVNCPVHSPPSVVDTSVRQKNKGETKRQTDHDIIGETRSAVKILKPHTDGERRTYVQRRLARKASCLDMNAGSICRMLRMFACLWFSKFRVCGMYLVNCFAFITSSRRIETALASRTAKMRIGVG